MILKASLHIHTSEDKKDGHMIDYNIYQLINEARKRGFRVLGFTPHQKFVLKEKHREYAQRKGIILIPGIELNLGKIFGNHVIILNCDKSAEKVKNFKQLAIYKKSHQNIFILSPHPTYSRLFSIGVRNLRKYINLFDAVEHSWLYSRHFNNNKKAIQIAQNNHKPIVATADVHVLSKLATDHCLIETENFRIDSVLSALRQGNFKNVTLPKKSLSLLKYISWTITKYLYKYFEQKILFPPIKKLIPVIIENNKYDQNDRSPSRENFSY